MIAAGTTGSMPATAALLKVIASMPNGKVILPGLDIAAGNDAWEAMDATHSQFGLKQLLDRMECERGKIRIYDFETLHATSSARVALLNEAMRPAAVTDRWREFQVDCEEALKGCTLHVCRTSVEEAKLIALFFRDALEKPGKTAALVTHDRSLAEQVVAEMLRYGVALDDSAGMPLSRTAEGAFIQLVAEALESRFAPLPFLALLKHPLAACGMAPEQCRRAVRQIEELALRGLRPASGISAILTRLEQRGDTVPQEARQLLMRLEEITEHYRILLTEIGNASLKTLIAAHIQICEAIAASDSEAGEVRLWEKEAGQFLKQKMEELLDAAAAWEKIESASYPDLIRTYLAPITWRPRYGKHPRLHILSPLEARLQKYDRMILGGIERRKLAAASERRPMDEPANAAAFRAAVAGTANRPGSA